MKEEMIRKRDLSGYDKLWYTQPRPSLACAHCKQKFKGTEIRPHLKKEHSIEQPGDNDVVEYLFGDRSFNRPYRFIDVSGGASFF
ncbi:hypothetical protein CC1G_13273 [Coprinopsis cinerea okayama7|uniref:Uncharacterized protein n=1 Tax=Coprinopsis cinerea (strain Okayama-7 / 130 / ATCC MYA-4618 / FGSC 9003) TaxID=240176 RepID=A8PIA2_COPC7|nr:hypothetical protein CC1G_13273 [Coprinopsis cinerea okayama7\|eukprot:XP_001841541.2 hypothetical protein CC1G_13273 [Coprinopsis cinerea okayama7\